MIPKWRHRSFRDLGGPAPKSMQVLRAERAARKLVDGGKVIDPVTIDGSAIATTFWGKAWCKNLESYSDFANRLPRGRSYVRNGCVVHLELGEGLARASVQGSELYQVEAKVLPVSDETWKHLVDAAGSNVTSLGDVLAGKLPESLLTAIVKPGEGLFPRPKEISFSCSCPDSATLCKHVAAVLYGIGARLDREPTLLFTLRRVDPVALVQRAVTRAAGSSRDRGKRILHGDLSAIFGIELDDTPEPTEPEKRRKRRATTTRTPER